MAQQSNHQLAFELEGVTKDFPVAQRSMPVLRGISFRVAAGESVAIMGPSGSGKSTLLAILGCLELPTSGRLKLLGQDTGTLSDDDLSVLRGRTMGFIFQAFHLLPAYDALSNVLLGSVYAQTSKAALRARDLLTTMGLGARLYHRPSMLSGGERQRVAIARALINDPRIILADEPTGSLDQKTGREILTLIGELHRQGRTLVLVTHDPQVASKAERVLEVVDGKILHDRTGRSLGR